MLESSQIDLVNLVTVEEVENDGLELLVKRVGIEEVAREVE